MPMGDDDTVAGSLPSLAGGAADVAEVIAGRYQLVRWLGGGGMGRVYEVLDTELGERVALKVLRGGLSEEAIARFRREVRLTRKIQHRNVARMFDIGEHNGDKFLTMELVDGEPLTRELGAPLSWSRIQSIATQICGGLAAAHELGVVHRDLKPDNVLIERATQRAVITDFGIARSGDDAGVTQVGVVIGTPRYMAPEQLAGSDVDARADIFSLGVMLYELAAATRPWVGDNAIHIAVAQATQPMRPLVASVPPAFVELVTACLALDRAQRPASAASIGEQLAAIEYAGRESPLPRGARPASRPTPTPTSSAGMTVLNAETAIAVLPFQSAEPDAYLADGIVEELIDILSTTAALRVRPAGALRGYNQADPREAGKQLGVDHVVSGSVRRTPAGLRVTARLVGIADGFQIWAHRADIADAEILALSDELARGVAQALSTRAAAATTPMAPAAVELYLRARAELRRFWGEHTEEATKLLEQADGIAPGSGPILSTLAYASVQAWTRRGTPDPLARAQKYVERGLASGYGEAHLAASNLELNLGNVERAAQELGLALARSPMSAPAHETAGRLLLEIESSEAGRRHIETTIGLDPGRTTMVQPELARVEALAGDWQAADRRIMRMVGDADPAIVQYGSVIEARFAVWNEDLDRVGAAVERVRSRLTGETLDLIGVYRKWRATGEFEIEPWRAYLATMFRPGYPHRPQLASLQRLAEIASALRQDAAIELVLRAAGRNGLLDRIWLDGMPLFYRLHGVSWFEDVRDQVRQRAARVLAAFRSTAG